MKMGLMDVYAAKGQVLVNQDALPDYCPRTATRRRWASGFLIGMGVAEGQTLPGPGKDEIGHELPVAQQPGFQIGVQFSLCP